MKHQCTEEGFLQDVSRHQIGIIRDDGLYRHIRFKRPDSGTFYFDLITWPGHLCYTGDMGTYVFSRVDDMFRFFRTDKNDFNFNKNGLSINPGYWAEKVLSDSRFGGHKEFDNEKFERVLKERVIEWAKEHRDYTTKEQRRELWDEFCNDVLGADEDQGGYRKQSAAYDFSFRVGTDRWGDDLHFSFSDLWEYNFTSYTFHYIWACYALAWGVQQYDNAKTCSEATA